MPTTGSDDLKALRAMSHKHATDASTTFGYMDRDYDKKVSLAELKSAYHGSHKAFGVDKYGASRGTLGTRRAGKRESRRLSAW